MSLFKSIKSWFGPQPKIEFDPMKYLIVGLGNIGTDYDNTRHNIGFDVIDALVKEFDVEMKLEGNAQVGTMKFKGRTLVLIKPTTYMNLSGKAVRYHAQKHKIPNDKILVILDDLNINFERIRLRGKGSDGGHNGLKHIDQMMGGNNYPRLRLGIGSNFGKGRQVDFVIGKWTSKELEILPSIIDHSVATVKAFVSIGIQHTMSQFNK